MTDMLEIRDALRNEISYRTLERKRYVLSSAPASDLGEVILLRSAFVQTNHAYLDYTARGWYLTPKFPNVRSKDNANQALGINQEYRLRANVRYTIGDFEIALVETDAGMADAGPVAGASMLPFDLLIHETKLRVSNETERLAGRGELNQDDPQYAAKIIPVIERHLAAALAEVDKTALRLCSREALRRDLILRILGHPGTFAGAQGTAISRMARDDMIRLHRDFFQVLGVTQAPRQQRQDLARLQAGFDETFATRANMIDFNLLKTLVEESVRQSVRALMVSIGPLEPLRAIDAISEIMVVAYDQIFVEIDGVLMLTGLSFVDEQESMRIAAKIARDSNTSVDRSMPYRDGRLSDGSRVNMVIPPIALKGATVTIRKFGKSALTLDRLLEKESLSPAMASFLRACVVAKKNIVVAGGTGSGKTTMVNWLGSMIPDSERVISIEDTAELQLPLEHLVSLQAVAKTADNAGHTIRDLVRNALRMRPDRIIIGECRGGEAFDMLQAMNTGHEGSMTTLHANNPVETMSRIENLVLAAGEGLPVDAIRYQIAGAIDFVVQLRQYADGIRKISEIAEIGTIDPVTNRIEVNPIFRTHYDPGRPENGTTFQFAGRTPEDIATLVDAGFDARLLMRKRAATPSPAAVTHA
jgi:pilus assembly protein CpaF